MLASKLIEKVVLYLLSANCIQIFLYGLETFLINKSQFTSLRGKPLLYEALLQTND